MVSEPILDMLLGCPHGDRILDLGFSLINAERERVVTWQDSARRGTVIRGIEKWSKDHRCLLREFLSG